MDEENKDTTPETKKFDIDKILQIVFLGLGLLFAVLAAKVSVYFLVPMIILCVFFIRD